MSLNVTEIQAKLEGLRKRYVREVSKRPIIVRQARALQIALDKYDKKNTIDKLWSDIKEDKTI